MAKKDILKRILCAALSACVIAGTSGIAAFAEKLEEAETIGEDGSVYAEEYVDDGTEPQESKKTKKTAKTEKTEKAENTENADTDANPAVPDTSSDSRDAVAGGADREKKEVTLPAKVIYLNQARRSKIVIGKSTQIKYRMTPSKTDDYVIFKNYNKNVVKVDEDGNVTAVGYGEARIQLRTSKGVNTSVFYTVTDEFGNVPSGNISGTATSVEFADKFIMLRAGKSAKAEPVFYPLGIVDSLTYSSSNSSVASVSGTGVITGVSAGSAVITAKTPSGVTAEINVTVYDDLLRGIDVSKWQGEINWKKVSVSGVDFAIIRSSFGDEDVDPCLDRNVKGCEANGIPYGFYHYTYAKSAAEARREAKFFLKTIRNYSPEYPVVLDIEEEFYKKMSKKKVTSIVTAFMDEIESAGYYGMIYNSPNFMKACIDYEKIRKYDIWIACWGDEDRLNSYYDGHYGIWQYSATGKVNGIKGDVDLDYCYKDYAAVIRKNGLNRL